MLIFMMGYCFGSMLPPLDKLQIVTQDMLWITKEQIELYNDKFSKRWFNRTIKLLNHTLDPCAQWVIIRHIQNPEDHELLNHRLQLMSLLYHAYQRYIERQARSPQSDINMISAMQIDLQKRRQMLTKELQTIRTMLPNTLGRSLDHSQKIEQMITAYETYLFKTYALPIIPFPT